MPSRTSTTIGYCYDRTMSKRFKVWFVLFVLAGSLALVGAIAGSQGFDAVKSITEYSALFLGGGVILKVLLWDWNEAKKDSTDKSFRLRK